MFRTGLIIGCITLIMSLTLSVNAQEQADVSVGGDPNSHLVDSKLEIPYAQSSNQLQGASQVQSNSSLADSTQTDSKLPDSTRVSSTRENLSQANSLQANSSQFALPTHELALSQTQTIHALPASVERSWLNGTKAGDESGTGVEIEAKPEASIKADTRAKIADKTGAEIAAEADAGAENAAEVGDGIAAKAGTQERNGGIEAIRSTERLDRAQAWFNAALSQVQPASLGLVANVESAQGAKADAEFHTYADFRSNTAFKAANPLRAIESALQPQSKLLEQVLTQFLHKSVGLASKHVSGGQTLDSQSSLVQNGVWQGNLAHDNLAYDTLAQANVSQGDGALAQTPFKSKSEVDAERGLSSANSALPVLPAANSDVSGASSASEFRYLQNLKQMQRNLSLSQILSQEHQWFKFKHCEQCQKLYDIRFLLYLSQPFKQSTSNTILARIHTPQELCLFFVQTVMHQAQPQVVYTESLAQALQINSTTADTTRKVLELYKDVLKEQIYLDLTSYRRNIDYVDNESQRFGIEAKPQSLPLGFARFHAPLMLQPEANEQMFKATAHHNALEQAQYQAQAKAQAQIQAQSPATLKSYLPNKQPGRQSSQQQNHHPNQLQDRAQSDVQNQEKRKSQKQSKLDLNESTGHLFSAPTSSEASEYPGVFPLSQLYASASVSASAPASASASEPVHAPAVKIQICDKFKALNQSEGKLTVANQHVDQNLKDPWDEVNTVWIAPSKMIPPSESESSILIQEQAQVALALADPQFSEFMDVARHTQKVFNIRGRQALEQNLARIPAKTLAKETLPEAKVKVSLTNQMAPSSDFGQDSNLGSDSSSGSDLSSDSDLGSNFEWASAEIEPSDVSAHSRQQERSVSGSPRLQKLDRGTLREILSEQAQNLQAENSGQPNRGITNRAALRQLIAQEGAQQRQARSAPAAASGALASASLDSSSAALDSASLSALATLGNTEGSNTQVEAKTNTRSQALVVSQVDEANHASATKVQELATNDLANSQAYSQVYSQDQAYSQAQTEVSAQIQAQVHDQDLADEVLVPSDFQVNREVERNEALLFQGDMRALSVIGVRGAILSEAQFQEHKQQQRNLLVEQVLSGLEQDTIQLPRHQYLSAHDLLTDFDLDLFSSIIYQVPLQATQQPDQKAAAQAAAGVRRDIARQYQNLGHDINAVLGQNMSDWSVDHGQNLQLPAAVLNLRTEADSRFESRIDSGLDLGSNSTLEAGLVSWGESAFASDPQSDIETAEAGIGGLPLTPRLYNAQAQIQSPVQPQALAQAQTYAQTQAAIQNQAELKEGDLSAMRDEHLKSGFEKRSVNSIFWQNLLSAARPYADDFEFWPQLAGNPWQLNLSQSKNLDNLIKKHVDSGNSGNVVNAFAHWNSQLLSGFLDERPNLPSYLPRQAINLQLLHEYEKRHQTKKLFTFDSAGRVCLHSWMQNTKLIPRNQQKLEHKAFYQPLWLTLLRRASAGEESSTRLSAKCRDPGFTGRLSSFYASVKPHQRQLDLDESRSFWSSMYQLVWNDQVKTYEDAVFIQGINDHPYAIPANERQPLSMQAWNERFDTSFLVDEDADRFFTDHEFSQMQALSNLHQYRLTLQPAWFGEEFKLDSLAGKVDNEMTEGGTGTNVHAGSHVSVTANSNAQADASVSASSNAYANAYTDVSATVNANIGEGDQAMALEIQAKFSSSVLEDKDALSQDGSISPLNAKCALDTKVMFDLPGDYDELDNSIVNLIKVGKPQSALSHQQ